MKDMDNMLDETNNYQAANNYQIQNTLGKIETKMDNQGSNIDKLTGKIDEMDKSIHRLNIDVTEIKAKQNPNPLRWPSILLAVLGCITAAAVVITLIITITKP